MDRTLLKALYIILVSLGLALIFNFLFFSKLIGLSVLIFAAALLGSVCLFGWYEQLSLRKVWWLIALIFFFSLMPSVRANEFLTFLNVCAMFGLLMILAHQLAGTPAFLMKLRDYIMLVVMVPFRMLGRAVSTMALVGQVHSKVKNRDVWLRALKGFFMALPILVLFGVLFSQADLAFSQFVKGFVNITISERSIQYVILLVFAFAAGLSYLSYIFFPKTAQPELLDKKPDVTIQEGRGIEVLVFLGLIAILFLVFIGFQVTYLFGGETNIVNAGFTYAEYARRGFWELLAVVVLSLLVLLASEKHAGAEIQSDKRFTVPALVLIVEVVVIIISAFKRLSLYIDAYGMSMLRFYAAGFIILLLVLFILLAIKFIQSRQEQFFAFGMLLSVTTFLIVVNLVNPDVFIIQSNMEQFNQTGRIDVTYIRELSVDAESEKIELFNKLEGEDKEVLRGLLQLDKDRLQQHSEHWQSGNISRSRALKLLNEL